MHWIHILKTPDAQKQPDGTWRVTTFVRILSDLSDRGTDSPVDILVELVDTKGKVLISDSVKRWRAKKYWLQPLEYSAYISTIPTGVSVLLSAISPRSNNAKSEEGLAVTNFADFLPAIVPVSSGPLERKSATRFSTKQQGHRYLTWAKPGSGIPPLRICEQTGESMERHMWDGGLAFAFYLTRLTFEWKGPQTHAAEPLRVVELGCGVGTVGIQFAQLVANCEVYLTDLPDAKEMVELNIKSATPAQGSRLEFEELDWETFGTVGNGPLVHSMDLILIADCFYNNDACSDLIMTIKRLVQCDDDLLTPVVVAYKFRDQSERVFFTEMEHAFEIMHEERLPLPDSDGVEESVRLIVYRHRKRLLSRNWSSSIPERVRGLPISHFWNEESTTPRGHAD